MSAITASRMLFDRPYSGDGPVDVLEGKRRSNSVLGFASSGFATPAPEKLHQPSSSVKILAPTDEKRVGPPMAFAATWSTDADCETPTWPAGCGWPVKSAMEWSCDSSLSS